MEFQTQSQYEPERENLIKIILQVIGGILILSIFLMLVYFSGSIKKIVTGQPSSGPQENSQEEPPEVTLPKILYNLAGTIEKLEKNSLTFEASIPQLNEAGQVSPKMELRKALITASTRFSRLTFVAKEGTTQKTPQETIITFKDLKLKDYIEVVSNQDILQAPEFPAVQIRILPH